MYTPRPRAYTLIELLVSLAVASLLAGIAMPAIGDMLRRNEATTAVNWLVLSINYTRHAAVTYRVTTTICPSADGTTCGGMWHEGTIVFTDRNRDRIVNGKDMILQRFEFPIEGATITWHAFQNRQYLQMLSSGYTNYQNGNFVYCPADADARFARQLVINMQGRPRTSKDIDGDGYVEDRKRKHLRC